MKIIAIIPARYGSTRLLGKPLIKINNKPLIQLTYEAVLNSTLFDSVFITTESQKIKTAVTKFGAECILTSPNNNNGTERCSELIQKLKTSINNQDIIINIQCDEPFIKKKHLIKIINSFNSSTKISTIISPISDFEIMDKSIVKVNISKNNTAINFSRKNLVFKKVNKIYKHIGIYGYRKETLLEIANLKTTKRELNEKLEQLRWVEYGYKITCVFISENLMSINTDTDLKKLSKNTFKVLLFFIFNIYPA